MAKRFLALILGSIVSTLAWKHSLESLILGNIGLQLVYWCGIFTGYDSGRKEILNNIVGE